MAWAEGFFKVGTIVKDLATMLTSSIIETDRWILHYPVDLASVIDKVILSTTTTNGLSAYLCIERPDPSTNFHYITMQISNGVDDIANELSGSAVSEKSKYYWYLDNDTSPNLADWLPVAYWVSATTDRIALVLMGDPSASYKHYLISFAYAGMTESFEGGDSDVEGNFALTVGSAFEPEYAKTYGDRTATGITDICMLKTRSGFPCQAHLPAFDTPSEFIDKHFMGPSTWTHKYPASQISIVHGYDNRRSKMIDVLAMDRSGVVHTDELIEDKGLPTEKTYKFFNINAPYSMFTNSPNVLYGIAIVKA